jgi:hypothetical protein
MIMSSATAIISQHGNDGVEALSAGSKCAYAKQDDENVILCQKAL